MAEGSTAQVYLRMVAARVRGDLQYRTSFALRLLSTVVITGIDFAVVVLVFGRVEHLGGWSFPEVTFLYGTASLAFHLAAVLVGNVDYVTLRVKQGTFDRLLMRPLSPLWQLLAEEFALRRLGTLLHSGGVLFIALVIAPVAWDAGRIAMIPVMISSGVGIYGGIWVATAAMAFWTVETKEFASAFTYGGSFLSQYPVSIYSGWLRRLLAFVVPMAFVSYFPALYVLGRNESSDRFGLPPAVMFASPLVAVVVCGVAMAIWRSGLRHYRSTGS